MDHFLEDRLTEISKEEYGKNPGEVRMKERTREDGLRNLYTGGGIEKIHVFVHRRENIRLPLCRTT